MIDVPAAKAALNTIRNGMVENREYLIELDAAFGDGDLGITMVRAFEAADAAHSGSDETDIGRFFSRVGMTIAKEAPSTIGTLVATGFMRGGKAVTGATRLDPHGVAEFFRAFADGIAERGKTQPGNKTVLDVFDPVATAAERAVAAGAGMPEVVAAARDAAAEALEDVKAMTAQHGRAGYYREQTVGKLDAGAAAGRIIVDGLVHKLG